MNCREVREHLNAWCDGQLEPDAAKAVQAHLDECGDCRALSVTLREQDSLLRKALSPAGAAADRIAAQVCQQFDLDQIAPVVPSSSSFSAARLISLLFATAAGFLLAVVIFQPWRYETPLGQITPPGNAVTPIESASARPTVAHLVAATGQVDVRPAGAQEWQATPLEKLSMLTCPSGSEVRTGPNVQCELKTPAGDVIRLNDQTQITLTGNNTIEIERGKMWCSTPDKTGLKVVTPGQTTQKTAAKAYEFACSSAACVQTAVDAEGCVEVTTSAGDIDLLTPDGSQRLKQGETVSIVDGIITKGGRTSDPLLAARWTQPLLVRKGHESPELGSYVDQLLARVGESKVSFLYEQDIRSLGEYAALPLLRYVQSPLSRDNPQRRQQAMRIAADIAPSWAIADMIALLADDDPNTRSLAATTLHRLTGLNLGRSPDGWREELNACEPTIAAWRQWWDENQRRYPGPPTSGNSGALKA
jgi:hypothetical protein